jgi:hypothetical protein
MDGLCTSMVNNLGKYSMVAQKIILFLLAGCFEGIMDHLQFHFDKNNYFWNPSLSWKNKWKNGDKSQGERFFLSSTVFVFTTDGWHLMKWFRNRMIDTLIFLFLYDIMIWHYALSITLLFRIVYGIGFHITYKKTHYER